MAFIYALDKGNTLATEAGLARDLDRIMGRIVQYKNWLDTVTDPDLAGIGFSVGDIAILRSAATDINKLAQIYQGLATQTPVYDFRTFAKLLYPYGSI